MADDGNQFTRDPSRSLEFAPRSHGIDLRGFLSFCAVVLVAQVLCAASGPNGTLAIWQAEFWTRALMVVVLTGIAAHYFIIGPARRLIAPLADPAHRRRAGLSAVREAVERYAQTERALRATRGQLVAFVEHAPAAVAMFDREMRYIACSRRWVEDYGLEGRPLIGKSHYEIFPEISQNWKSVHQRCLGGAVERMDEECFVRADGKVQWLRWEVRPWRTIDGAIGGIVMYTADVTKQREAQTRVNESQQLLQTVLDVLPQRVYWKNREGRYLGANRAFLQDVEASNIIGLSDEDFANSPQEAEWRSAADRRVMESNDPELNYIEQIPVAGGERRSFSVCKMPLRDANGEAIGVLGTYLDVTHVMRLEADAAERLASLERAERIARLGHWTLDLRKGVAHCSNGVYRLIGRDVKLGDPTYTEALSDFDDESSRRIDDAIQTAIRTGKSYSITLKLRNPVNGCEYLRADGEVRRDEDGKVIELCGTLFDVTERVRRERELEEARAAAEAANRSKSEFLTNMSHEIRTPMTAILGYAELLDEASTDSQRAEYVATIQRNGAHLLALINDILDLSKIEAGRLAVERIPISPTAIIDDVIALMNVRARDKRIELSRTYLTPMPTQMLSDPVRLRQILTNLVGNAIKFTQRGRVDVSVSLESEPRQRLCVRVRDTGIGMTDEQMSRVFDSFVQADASTARRFGGSGLGLSISQRLARLLDGEITVESKLGDGTTFTFLIPVPEGTITITPAQSRERFQPADGQRVSDGAAEKPLEGLNILLAEDGVDNQKLITFILRRAGAQVTVAADGQQAIDRLLGEQAQPFDLVLMDMQMPHVDGYTATRRARESGLDLPIIALTAHAMSQERQKCLDAGCNDFGTKPIDRTQLIEMIRHWTDRARSARPTGRDISRPPRRHH